MVAARSEPVAEHPALRDQWFVVADAAEWGDGPVGVGLLGERYVVWRTGDGVAAALDRCPHREAPLSVGRCHDGVLRCAYHGWAFDRDGACVAVPAAGPRAPIPPSAGVRVLPVRERHGLIWMSPGEPSGEPPVIPEDDDPSFRRLNAGTEVWDANVTRMVDNFCDVAHFPYVHADTLGADVDPEVPSYRVERLDDSFTGYRYEVDVDGPSGTRVRQEMTTGFALPFTVRSTTRVVTGPAAGSDRILLLCASPIDRARTLFTFVVWRSGGGDVSDEAQLAFDRAVGAEDRAMLELVPGELPVDVGATVNGSADRLSVAWRRRLAEVLAVSSVP